MDVLDEQLCQLIAEICTLDPTNAEEKKLRRKLLSELWQLIDSLDSLDKPLRWLIAEVCKLDKTNARERMLRRELLTKMWQLINESGKLWKENTPYYEEALQKTWVYLCEKPENYDPTQKASVLTWLDKYLKWRLHDLKNEAAKEKKLRQPPLRLESGDIADPLELVESRPDAGLALRILEQIRTWVENNPELNCIHIENRPDLTCAILILRRLPPETEFKVLSEEFGVAKPTLSSFYERKCRPRLIDFLKSQGYSEPEKPIDPVEDIKIILKALKARNRNILQEIQTWIETEAELEQIRRQCNSELTGRTFLIQLLNSGAKLKAIAESFNVDIAVLQKFYEFQCRPRLHNFLEFRGYSIREIYKGDNN